MLNPGPLTEVLEGRQVHLVMKIVMRTQNYRYCEKGTIHKFRI